MDDGCLGPGATANGQCLRCRGGRLDDEGCGGPVRDGVMPQSMFAPRRTSNFQMCNTTMMPTDDLQRPGCNPHCSVNRLRRRIPIRIPEPCACPCSVHTHMANAATPNLSSRQEIKQSSAVSGKAYTHGPAVSIMEGMYLLPERMLNCRTLNRVAVSVSLRRELYPYK
jgi:hypothetical protein